MTVMSFIKLHSYSSTKQFPQGCGPESLSVVKGDVWKNEPSRGHGPKESSANFLIKNIFTHYKAETYYGGYWLARDDKTASFIINLGCLQRVSQIKLVNTHNQNNRDRSTKKFRYLLLHGGKLQL